jgi:hypothetical protein
MPTPRQHGGAALQHIPMTVPGFSGLNKQSEGALLGPEWATLLVNATIDDAGRVAARKGWSSVTTTTAASAQIKQLFEYRKYDGTVQLIAGLADTDIERSTDDGDTWADITGTASHAATNIQFLNFSDVVYGITDDAEDNIIYTGTSFADDAATGRPTGSVGMAAFGRIWATDTDNTVVQYSALLDHTDWNGTDAGNIDLRNVWPEGDNVTALAAFNGALVIFGRNNIAIYSDGAGSVLGVDPTQLYLVDTISGLGCIARDSVANVDGDLWFLSDKGIFSLSRLIQEKSNPLANLSANVQDFLQGNVNATTASNIRAVYSAVDRVYLLSLPREVSSAEAGLAFAFDTRGKLQDGTARCMGVWELVPTANVIRLDGTWLISRFNTTGEVGNYTGQDDDGSTYNFEYNSGWLDLTQQGFLIMPKRISGLFFLDSDSTVNLTWAFDFESTFQSRQLVFSDIAAGAEWGEGEFGVGVYGGGLALRDGKAPASNTGEFIKLGVTITINGGQFALQQLDLFAKIGRFK